MLALSLALGAPGQQEPAPPPPQPSPAAPARANPELPAVKNTPANDSTAPQAAPAANDARPLPDIGVLLREVVAHERRDELARKDYIYNATMRFDRLQKDGSVKQQETNEYENFTINGVSVSRHLKHNGQALSADEQKKENERIDKEVAEAKARRAKADAGGKDSNSRGDEIISIARMFELGDFTNPRRVRLAGRDTIAVDFTGNPGVKTHNRGEDAIHDMAGTAWIDEQDKTIARLEGRFISNFKIGGGLLASIARDTTFEMLQGKVNDEVWLPRHIEVKGHARFAVLFAIDGHFDLETSNYRKFKASATLLPGASKVEQPAGSALGDGAGASELPK